MAYIYPWRKKSWRYVRTVIKKQWKHLPVKKGWLALTLLLVAVIMCGVESAYVQLVTTYRIPSPSLLLQPSFLLLLTLDTLIPLIVALLSRRAFMLYIFFQCILSVILLHYQIFFYNPLTLSTIYHSMQGAASLGIDIFGFARPDIILCMGVIMVLKLLLVRLSWVNNFKMPYVWQLRGVIATSGMFVICVVYVGIYGRTGLSPLWIDSLGHRTATERRLEYGTRESIRNIGYLGTWIGEWMSGTYKDTELIYAEVICPDPDGSDLDAMCSNDTPPPLPGDGFTPANTWQGLPLPPLGDTFIMIQIESLDFAALSMKVNGHTVTPFIDQLCGESMVLKAFAPHKVGSSNSDYEILNSRVAAQNIIYYSYISDYPHSIIAQLARKGYHPTIIHGLEGKLFNLRQAYENQGFERLFFKEELTEYGYPSSNLIMQHVTDNYLFDFAAERMMDTAPRSQFIITMTSHVPFIEAMPIFKKAGGLFSRYVSSLRYLDQAFAAYYARLPAGTVIILWGDHGSDVGYPAGFPENARHVPFIVHVKGNSTWIDENSLPRGITPYPAEIFTDVPTEDMEIMRALMNPVGKQETPQLASSRVYRLCELSHFIRKILQQ